MFEAKEIKEKSIWEEFVLKSNPFTFLQSWNWGDVHQILGEKVIRLGFLENNKLVAVAQIIEQKAKRGKHLLVPGGPILDWQNKRLIKFITDQLKNIAQKDNCWFVRIRPDVKQTAGLEKIFSKCGFVISPMHVHAQNTIIVDISKNEEDILAQMRKNTRYSIKKSLKNNLQIKISTDPDDAKILSTLQKNTVRRHKFVGFQNDLFEAQLKSFGKDNMAELFICSKNDHNLVAAIIIYYQDSAFYHHSASSESARDLLASYFTQWQIIKRAKQKGIKYYNMWGVAPENSSVEHRFWGVTLFKQGFGGERVDLMPAYDIVVNPLYWTTHIFEKLRKISRRL